MLALDSASGTEMAKENRKSHPEAQRTRVMEYALLTALVWLGIFACMAFLRYGTG